MKPLRIVLLMIEPPLPFGLAGARWYYVLLKGLVERGHRVTAFATCSKREEIQQAKALFPAPAYDLRCYPHPVRSGLGAKLETLRRPYSYMFSPELHTDLERTLAGGYDILHLEQLWSGWAGLRCEVVSKAVLNFHSLYDLDQSAQPPSGIRERFERRLRRRGERRLLRSYPALLTLTPRLREAAHAIARRADIHVVPLGLDYSLYPFTQAEQRPHEPVISLVGSMNWSPSRSAAVRLIMRLWPEVRRLVPNARVEIVGRQARRALSAYLSEKESNVQIFEDVPDTRRFFERATVMLYAPESASGMKVKVLEAFAYGVPVVTTSYGVEGTSARDGVHAGISDEDAGLIERTVALLGNRDLQERYRIAARTLVKTECGPETTLDRLEDCYVSLVCRSRACAA